VEDIGAQRAAALKAAEAQLERVARLLPNALGAGLSLTEISRLTDVSRPTLYQLRARQTAAEGNVRLAILQTVANHGWTDRETLIESISSNSACRTLMWRSSWVTPMAERWSCRPTAIRPRRARVSV